MINNTERIIVTNTAIIVQDYELHSCEELERVFSKWDGINHKLSYMCFYYDEENQR